MVPPISSMADTKSCFATCMTVIWVPISPVALAVCAAMQVSLFAGWKAICRGPAPSRDIGAGPSTGTSSPAEASNRNVKV
jgi:hypothetical protein